MAGNDTNHIFDRPNMSAGYLKEEIIKGWVEGVTVEINKTVEFWLGEIESRSFLLVVVIDMNQGHHLRILDEHRCPRCIDSCRTSIACEDDDAMAVILWIVRNILEKGVPEAAITISRLCFVDYENRCYSFFEPFVLVEMNLPGI